MRYKNNPANIRYNVWNKWKGLVGNDNGFCEFESFDYGVRALVIILKKYICVYKRKSVQAIISYYAPSCENDTRNYVAYVERVLVNHGFDPDHLVYMAPSFVWLCIAICWFETHTTITEDQFFTITHKFSLSI